MSTASLCESEVGRADWITLAEASRLLGRAGNPSSVKSIALAGGIRTRSLPGTRTLYLRSDVASLADSRPAPSSATAAIAG
jgi:hypothetical protein